MLLFEPRIRAGIRTSHGMRLTRLPSLDSDPKVKFAVFDDPRFFHPKDCDSFTPFLPEGFTLVGPPETGQNCWIVGNLRAI